jgi:hypothetical protein
MAYYFRREGLSGPENVRTKNAKEILRRMEAYRHP